MNNDKVGIGIIGAGNISSIYLETPTKFKNLNVIGVADIDMVRAKAQGEKYGVPAMTVDELLANPAVEIIINLTVPLVHGQVALRALEAGKNVYTEKPLAYDKAEAARMLAVAKEKGLLVGGAPDTFMGGGLQTCRQLIDSGEVGQPVAGVAHMLSRGMEAWHPNPDFFFQRGGGPMFDIGPYYLTAFVSLFGPAKSVVGGARITHAERTITSQPLSGTKIQVNVPTTVMGVIEFVNNAMATVIMTWDVAEGYTPRLEVYGTKASLICPDPNTFGGPVKLRRAGDKEWSEIAIEHGWTTNSRGLGVADMAHALRSGKPFRANGAMASHVLEMMHAFHESAETGRRIDLTTTCAQPEPLPIGYP